MRPMCEAQAALRIECAQTLLSRSAAGRATKAPALPSDAGVAAACLPVSPNPPYIHSPRLSLPNTSLLPGTPLKYRGIQPFYVD